MQDQEGVISGPSSLIGVTSGSSLVANGEPSKAVVTAAALSRTVNP